MKLEYIYEEYGHYIPDGLKIDLWDMPKKTIHISEYKEFNELYQNILCRIPRVHEGIDRTNRGTIRVGRGRNLELHECFDIKVNKGCGKVVFTVLLWTGSFQLTIANTFTEEELEAEITGGIAWREFLKILATFGISIEDFAITNGKEIADTIVMPYRGAAWEGVYGSTFYDVFHIDINSAYMAGVAKKYPELAPAIYSLYDKRRLLKEIPDYLKTPEEKRLNLMIKAILNMTYGYMRSEWVDWKYAHIAKEGVEYCKKKIVELRENLENHGCSVIFYSVDAVWGIGDISWFESSNEIGECKLDMIVEQFSARSAEAYEYIYKGKYKPKVCGLTTLDKIKPRSQWEWGDIYYQSLYKLTYKFEKGIGITEHYEVI